MRNEVVIYSIDYSKRRMKVWKREAKRMGVKVAIPIMADARQPLPINTSADLVILDRYALEENGMLIEKFLKWHQEFVLAEASPRIGLPGL